jgi:hypothetical protein
MRVLKNPPAQGGWNGQKVDAGTGEALPGLGTAVREETVRITGREVASSREGVGGGDSSDDGTGQHNPARAKRPCFTGAGVGREGLVSAR